MERMSRGGAVAATVRRMTHEQLKAFYADHYPRLVKVLCVLGASLEEAEDAAQKAMADFAQRASDGRAPSRAGGAYVLTAARHYFIKERQRDRDRQPRELHGGHLTPEGHLDDQLTAWEDQQYVERLLAPLSDAQREVIERVMDGMKTPEIAAELGKTEETIRQNLKKGRDRLKQEPEIAPIASRNAQAQSLPRRVRSTATTPEPRKEEVQ